MAAHKNYPTLMSMLISTAVDGLAPRKTQKDLAYEMGFVRANMLSMMRSGATRVPFGRIPILAGVLGLDPALLLRVHLAEQWPEFEHIVDEIFGGILTTAERDWIEFFSEVGLLDPPADATKRQKLIEILQREEWDDEEQ